MCSGRKAIAELFDTSVLNINKHINNILTEHESPTPQLLRITQ